MSNGMGENQREEDWKKKLKPAFISSQMQIHTE